MDEKNNYLLDRLDYLEFRQSLLFLKPPQHRTQLFYDLNLEDFLKIRTFTHSYCKKIDNNENISLHDYSRGLLDIWPSARLYPLSSSLIAEALMPKDLYIKLATK